MEYADKRHLKMVLTRKRMIVDEKLCKDGWDLE